MLKYEKTDWLKRRKLTSLNTAQKIYWRSSHFVNEKKKLCGSKVSTIDCSFSGKKTDAESSIFPRFSLYLGPNFDCVTLACTKYKYYKWLTENFIIFLVNRKEPWENVWPSVLMFVILFMRVWDKIFRYVRHDSCGIALSCWQTTWINFITTFILPFVIINSFIANSLIHLFLSRVSNVKM